MLFTSKGEADLPFAQIVKHNEAIDYVPKRVEAYADQKLRPGFLKSVFEF